MNAYETRTVSEQLLKPDHRGAAQGADRCVNQASVPPTPSDASTPF